MGHTNGSHLIIHSGVGPLPPSAKGAAGIARCSKCPLCSPPPRAFSQVCPAPACSQATTMGQLGHPPCTEAQQVALLMKKQGVGAKVSP
jgi:hypothetical protein